MADHTILKGLGKMAIKWSKEHGLNPCIPRCFVCGEDKNEILLLGLLPGDEEAPKGAVFNKEPCEKCKEYMKIGVIFIVVKDGESGDNPYRTGGFFVVKYEAAKKIFPDIDGNRIIYLEESAAKKIGFKAHCG
jgi:hypothetical protein